MSERPSIARVRPDSRVPQLDREFDYRIPPGMEVVPGVRVRVPMGRGSRVSSGIVTAVVDRSDYTGKLGDVEQVVSEVVVAPPELLSLAEEVAVRNAGGVSDVLRLAVPPRAVRAEKAWLSRDATPRTVPELAETSPSQLPANWQELVTAGNRHWWQLAHGVSDDGHTHAAIQLAQLCEATLQQGQSVVLVVPDWRDIDQLRTLLEDTVGSEFLAVFDSEHTNSQRYHNYLRCLESDPVVVLGSRHAIYTPVSNLGLILVYNDSDDSHREPLAPYPHTRDIALIRAEQTGVALCMASLVPSIAVDRLISMGYLRAQRNVNTTRPRVIPTSNVLRADDSPNQARLPSVAYSAVKSALQDGPVLIQVFRAGFSPGLACAQCFERARCPECSGPLSRGQNARSPQCGWCGHLASRWRCSECSGEQLRPIGHGVGRTVSELGKAFPGVKVIQADGEHRITSVPQTPALVVATRGAEPVVPGGYRAALLLDGASMLQRPSLSALTETAEGWEWALSLLHPAAIAYLTDVEGPVVNAFCAGMYEDTLSKELAERSELALPPSHKLALVEADAQVIDYVVGTLKQKLPRVSFLGPVSGEGLSMRLIVKSSYHDATALAKELRAIVVEQSLARRRGAPRIRVSFDAQHALDRFDQDSQ